MLLLAVATMSLSAYDRAQAEADAELIRIYEEESRIFKDLEWQEGTREYQWFLFYSLQALDVYSTHRGLKYDCICLLYTSPSPRDGLLSRMPSSA